MKKLLPVMIAALVLSVSHPVRAQVDPALAAGFQNIIDTHFSAYGIEGVEATMILPGECFWTGVSGWATSPNDPVDTTRFWHFASTTKALTATVILQLHDVGIIDINNPIGLYWDNRIKNIRSNNNNPVVDSLLTIKRLLNHTTNIVNTWYSGSPLWIDVFDSNCSVWTLDSALNMKYWEDSGPLFPVPNFTYVPWNNYVILGLLVEAVTGNTLQAEVQNRIFTPLGMTHSYFGVNGVNMSTINGMYNVNSNQSTACRDDYLSTRGGSSWWIGSTKEAARFMRAMHTGQLFSQNMTDSSEIKTPGAGLSANLPCIGQFVQYYGYGTEIAEVYPTGTTDTLLMYGHGGNGLGGSSSLHYKDLGITISIAGNDYDFNTTFKTAVLLSDLMCYAINNLAPSNCLTGIDEIAESDWSIYPNPGKDLLSISGSGN